MLYSINQTDQTENLGEKNREELEKVVYDKEFDLLEIIKKLNLENKNIICGFCRAGNNPLEKNLNLVKSNNTKFGFNYSLFDSFKLRYIYLKGVKIENHEQIDFNTVYSNYIDWLEKLNDLKTKRKILEVAVYLYIIKKLKLVDFASSNIEKTIQEADIIIVGIPVAAYKEVFKKICNDIKPGAIITDVGSVKKEVINSVKKYIPKNVDFVPGHPIAGTENSGPESGFAGLFKNGWCILTPNKSTSKNSVKIIKYMWQLVGMKVDIMDSNYHDEVLAITSHIPHIIAYSIVGTIANLQTTIKKEVIKYAASGFRDFTRIAASDPIMWRDIILYNRQSILKMLNLFKKDLSKLESAIKNNDDKFLLNLFTKTRRIRKDIIK